MSEGLNRALHEAQGKCWNGVLWANPDYFNDLAAAFSLVEWMRRERLGSFRISDTYSPYAWCVSIDGSDGNEIAHAEHESLPTAISLAAARALGISLETKAEV